MNTMSLWQKIEKNPPSYPELTKNLDVDVLIIGAGITGVTCAEHLIEAGMSVAILEADKAGLNTTGHSTGNLYIPVQPYYQNMVKKFDLKTAKAVATARQLAINYLESNSKNKKIDCNFHRRPWFVFTNDQKRAEFLSKEVETFHAMDFPLQYTDEMPLSFKFTKAAKLENQARMNPYAYVLGVCEWLASKECQIYEHSRVLEVEQKKTFVEVKTNRAKVKAKHVIIATHTPININTIQMYTAPYRSYAVAMHLADETYPEGHYWDLEDPHHVVCTHSYNKSTPDVVIVSGSHHKVGQESNTEEHFQELKLILNKELPTTDVVAEWSAQHYHSADTVPYIGYAQRGSKNIYTATGYFADGLLYGPIAGAIIAASILGQKNTLAPVFNSRRHKLMASLPFLIKENLNVFKEYYTDMPKLLDNEYKNLKAGEGKIIQKDQSKWAVCRDDNNELHIVSAVCTHMKCIVEWNNAERTWDCPCHGSRFKPDGEVIEGPATRPLSPQEK